MRNWLLKFLIVAMLFVSMEGVAEPIDEAGFHSAHHAHSHVDDVGDHWVPDSDSSEPDDESCAHFCHGHVVALTAQISLPGVPMTRQGAPASSVHCTTRAAAPPTPPPNI